MPLARRNGVDLGGETRTACIDAGWLVWVVLMYVASAVQWLVASRARPQELPVRVSLGVELECTTTTTRMHSRPAPRVLRRRYDLVRYGVDTPENTATKLLCLPAGATLS